MPTIDLPHGTVSYRAAGPEDSAVAPVVFVHGLLVSGTLWTRTADALAAAGVRSYAPDWPLGSHAIALAAGAERTPRGVAGQIVAFLEAMDLHDVTLVGNDTGGALCQFVLDTDSSRVGRLVLTNCDAFDVFPPAPFDLLVKALRNGPAVRALIAPMRSTAVRHSAAGFGTLVSTPLDPAQTRAWVDPCLEDGGVREDLAAFAQAIDPSELLGVSQRLAAFDRPALLVWGAADRMFKPEFAHRLRETLPDARLVEVDGAKTFLPHDEPDRLASEIAAFVGVADAVAG